MTLAEVHVEGLRAVPSHLLGVVVGLRRYSRAAQRASEAALTNFSKALSREVSPQGIRVNTIVPGPVSTDLWTGLGGMADTIAAGRASNRRKPWTRRSTVGVRVKVALTRKTPATVQVRSMR
jgi:NAD(P)-dependent dehydrogenase (short-subunit alcohol dehydrogenase family)